MKQKIPASIDSAVTATRRQERWRAENRAAIEAYNDRIERFGAFSDDLRRF
jgi:post-segregation antitoxin (ccd killing protein)